MIQKRSLFTLSFYSLLIFGIAVSAYTLFTQSIRLDEAQSIWFATKTLPTILTLTSQDVHVPLYNLLLHFWMQFFGNSIVAARALSLLFYLATIPVLYLMAREASNQKIALITVLFFSLSPFILWYTTEARMYTLFTFVTSLNHVYFLRFLRSGGKTGKTGYFFSLIAGMYTHYFFLLLIVTQGLLVFAYFVLALQHKRATHERKSYLINKSVLLFFTGVMLSALLFFIPWIWYVLRNGAISNTQPLIPPPTSYNIIQTFVNFLFGFQTQGVQSLLVSLWPLIVVIFFFVFTKRERERVEKIEYFVVTSFFPIVLVFLISFIKPIFLSRYLILVTPTLFFLLAWTLLSYSKKIATYLISIFLITMVGLIIYQNTSSTTPVREDYKGAATYLMQQATPEDIISVSAPFTVYPIEYSYKGVTKITTIPPWNRYTEGAIPPFSLASLTKQMQGYATVYKRAFIVLSYNQGYESRLKQFFDSNYQLLDKKKFSPGLEVRVYKLRYDQ